jgi:hypothetical protein
MFLQFIRFILSLKEYYILLIILNFNFNNKKLLFWINSSLILIISLLLNIK